MAQIKQLKDIKTNSAIYPVTHLQAVVGAESIVETQEAMREQLDIIHQDINSIDSKIDNLEFPEIDTSQIAKEQTLQWVAQTSYDTMNTGFNSVNSMLNNIQGPNTEATNSAILALLEQVETSNDELIALQLQNIIG